MPTPPKNNCNCYKLHENGVPGAKFPKENFRNQMRLLTGQLFAGITELQPAGQSQLYVFNGAFKSSFTHV